MAQILVIDDDRSIRNTIARMLTAHGFGVVATANGKDALKLCEQEHPVMVITDIIMPEQEGIETIRQILDHQPGAKIIAISGGGRIGNTDFLQIARKVGATEVLPKPFYPDDLLQLVQNCIAAA